MEKGELKTDNMPKAQQIAILHSSHDCNIVPAAEVEHQSSDGTGCASGVPQQSPRPYLPASGFIGSPFYLAVA
jgi:hypothetical protein